jgi:hypothetical protein
MSKNRYLNFLNRLIIIVVICTTSEEDLHLSDLVIDPGIIIGEPTTSPNSVPQTSPRTLPSDNSTVLPYERPSSSGGLSTGGIVGIVIPSVAALIGVGAAAALCKAAPSAAIPIQPAPLAPPNFIDTSLDKFTTPMEQVVVQQQQHPVQPVQLVEQPIYEPQIVQEIPVQPAKIIPPPKKMALIQEVVHQPVQVVEQVPVIEQVPVFEQVPVIENVPVLQQVPALENAQVIQQVPVMQQVPGIQQFPVIQQGIPGQNMVHQIGPIGQQVVHLPPNAII